MNIKSSTYSGIILDFTAYGEAFLNSLYCKDPLLAKYLTYKLDLCFTIVFPGPQRELIGPGAKGKYKALYKQGVLKFSGSRC